MLGEALRAYHVARGPRARACQRGGRDAGPEREHARRDARAAAPREAGFHDAEQLIRDERQARRRYAAEQHGHPVLHLQARENVVAKARLAHGRGQRGRADHPDGRRAHAGHQHRGRERQLHAAQALPVRHARAARRFDHRRIELQDARHAVANHGQHRIQHEREQRGQEPERGEPFAEQPLAERREREQQRIEEGEQREARDRLHHARERQHRPAHSGAARRGDREQHAEREPEAQRRRAQHHVLAQVQRQHAPRRGDALIHLRLARAAPPRAVLAGAACPSTSARRRARDRSSARAGCRPR